MNMRLLAITAGLTAIAAAPCLALTVQSAPPSPDVAHRLTQGGASFGQKLEDTWAGSGRPGERSDVVNGRTYRSTQSFGSGTVTTTFRTGASQGDWADPRWNDQRRETPAPLSLSPPRR